MAKVSHAGCYDSARLAAQQHVANEAELGRLSDAISHKASQHGLTLFWHFPTSIEAGLSDEEDDRQHG